MATTPFRRVTYTEVVGQLQEENARNPDRFVFNDIHWGMDLQVRKYGRTHAGNMDGVQACRRTCVRACVRVHARAKLI